MLRLLGIEASIWLDVAASIVTALGALTTVLFAFRRLMAGFALTVDAFMSMREAVMRARSACRREGWFDLRRWDEARRLDLTEPEAVHIDDPQE